MQTFISETLEDILRSTDMLNNVVLILPSQRAGVYVKHTLKEHMSSGFLPEIITIETFLEKVSGLKKVDTIQLLFDFYSVYKESIPDPVSFDAFSSWAITVLQDFNEIDQYLIDPQDLFVYLRDIQRLRKWSVQGEFVETDLIKDHHSFLEKLHILYPKLYALLLENKSGYQGLLYKESTKRIDTYISQNRDKRHIFIGFNALNKAEEFLVQKVLETGTSDIYWDIDESFLFSNHQAGSFIRRYKTNWKYYQKYELKTIGKAFNEKKNIRIIAASKNSTQIKYAGEILSSLESYSNTAFVLGDESLLPVALSSLPRTVEDLNITMGYPLKNIPASQLIHALFQVFLTQERLQKKEEGFFYYKDVLALIRNPTISKHFSEEEDLITKITEDIYKKNASFLTLEDLLSLVDEGTKQYKTLALLFHPFSSVALFIDKVLQLIDILKEDTSVLEKEYLYRFYQAFNMLSALQSKHQYFSELKTLSLFFKQVIASENLFFQGEPLRGLQLMGMLETRVLDFENVIITSVNEGNLPSNSSTASFIPFDVKVHFGMPTYKEKDAIFSYHFFRLIQRAKNVFLLYNTESDSYGNGEKSRFLMQLELLRDDIHNETVSAYVRTEKKRPISIVKDPTVLNELQLLAQKGISPSALTNYLYNPIAFYKQKILHLKEMEEIEETVAANTLGSVIHDVLDDLYTPYIGKILKEKDILSMKERTSNLVLTYFQKYFKKGDTTTGKNRLIFEVAHRFLERFLTNEIQVVRNHVLKIVATEKHFEASIPVETLGFSVKIKGIVDRVDELDGVIRVIDYKTGVVKPAGLKLSGVESIEDYKYSKAIQLLLYAFLYTQNTKDFDFTSPITAGIFSFKNLKEGLLSINFSEKRNTKDTVITEERLHNFMQQIGELISNIFNPKLEFEEPRELPF